MTATGTLSGLDGVSRPAEEVLSLTHNVGEPPTPRLVARRVLINNVTRFDLAVARTGIPIEETFVLLNISRPATPPGSSVPQPESIGDPVYIADHIGRLTSLSVDTDRLDAALTATRADPFPVPQRTGYTMVARWEADDPCMPFTDASQPIDVSRFLAAVFGALSTAVTGADANSNLFRLGGSGDDGDFELWLVPHTQHGTLVDFGMPRNGFTVIFKTTIIAGGAEAEAYVPLSIIFARLPGVGGRVSLDASLDLIQLGLASEDRARVTIQASGLLAGGTAQLIRERLFGAVTSLPAATLNSLTVALGAFSAMLNSLRPNGGNGPLAENARVVLFPGVVPEGATNRLIPGGLQPRLCILD